MGLVTVMAGGGDVLVCLLPERRTRMHIVAKLRPFAVVHQQDADISSYMTIPQHIHVVEESEVACHTEIEFVRMHQ